MAVKLRAFWREKTKMKHESKKEEIINRERKKEKERRRSQANKESKFKRKNKWMEIENNW